MQKRFFKKAGSVILASALLCGGAAVVMPQVTQTGIEAQAANSERDFYTEEARGGGLIITGYKGTATDVIIPAKIFGEQVVEVRSLGEANASITSITIPNGCNKVEDSAFKDYTSLKSVTMPNSVNLIGNHAFQNCTSLTSVTLPNKLDDYYLFEAFAGCTSLKKVTIPKGWKQTGARMFMDCTALTTVSLPDTLTMIGYNDWNGATFQNCTALSSITIPESVTELHEYTFDGCKSLASITLPKGVKRIGRNCFSSCTSLKKISILGTLESISREAFYNCSSLTEITIPEGTTKISYGCAFGNCQDLKKITIPESVTEIDDSTFLNDSWEGTFTSPDLVIYGKKNSTADKFANNHDIPFKPIIASTGVVFDTSGISLNAKETYKIKATIKPDDVTINTLTWKSSNTNVATVSDNGTVTAKGSGVATITATTADNKTAKCTVTVYGSPTSISLSNAQMTLGKNETTKLTATVGPQFAKDKTVKWRTSNSKVLTVDQKGNVKAVGIGMAWITATANGNSKLAKSCKITVNNAPTKITLTKGIVTIGVGEKFTVGSGVDNGAGCAKRTYRTSNSSIVKMTRTDWNGDFYGVKPGIAYVTVRTYNGKESTCKVTVKAAPTSVTISKKTLNLKVGATATLSCSIPSNAGCALRTFRTSNSNVVKMTKTNWTGSFKAVAPGTAYVTVRTYNGKESTCKVTVTR